MCLVRSDDDAALIDGCRAGDRRCLERVLRREAPALLALLVRLVGPRADADDLLQRSLEAAVRAFPSFRGEASVRTWLTRIAVRVAMHELSRPRRDRVGLELVTGLGSEAPVESVIMARQQLHRVHEHLASLPVKQRVAFVLHVIDGRPVQDVAALMSATQTATKSRIFLARRALFRRAERDPVLRELMEGSTP